MSGQIKRGRASTPFSSPSSTCGKNEAKVIPIYHCINQCFSCKFTLKIILWEKFHISSCKYQNDKKFQEFKTSQTSNSPKAVVVTLQKCKRRDIRPCVPQPLCSLYSNVPTCIFYIGMLGLYTFLHSPSSFGEFQSHQLAQPGKKDFQVTFECTLNLYFSGRSSKTGAISIRLVIFSCNLLKMENISFYYDLCSGK